MNQGELMQALTDANPWWREESWYLHDPDLRHANSASFTYEPDALRAIEPNGLYFLRGPRRVGKSVEIKRCIARLTNSESISPRDIVHFACNGLSDSDLRGLITAAQRLRGPSESPMYWFLDEVTAAKKGWCDTVAHLRDNNARFREDCVVLTGSSSKELDLAIKALAGRRGLAGSNSDRIMMPMGFKQFCYAVEPELSFPDMEILRPQELVAKKADKLVYELAPYIGDITRLWELFLRVGGYPRAVQDYKDDGRVSDSFIQALWHVIIGEAIKSTKHSKPQLLRLLAEMSDRLASTTNLTQVAEECGFADHTVAKSKIDELVTAYLLWPCHQDSGQGLPKVKAYRKYYYIDPLLSRLAHELNGSNRAPHPSAINEQQLGVALMKSFELHHPGTWDDFSGVLHKKTSSGGEIDFVGPALGGVGIEGKYVDSKKTQATSAIKADKALEGIMATRAFLDIEASVRWIPTSFIVWLVEPQTR